MDRKDASFPFTGAGRGSTTKPFVEKVPLMVRALGARLFESPYLLLTLTTLFWAGNAIAGRLAAGVIPPFTLTCIRWIITASIVYVVARPMIREGRAILSARWPFLFVLGATGFAGFNFALYGALNFTTAINVTIEQSAMPMVIILLSFVVFRERFSGAQALGVLLSIAGVVLTATRGDPAALLRLDLNIGDAIMMIGVMLYSAYSVALRRKPALDWRVFMFALAVSAAVFSLPFAISDVVFGRFPEAGWKAPAILTYVVLFPSLLSQIFFIRGVELIGANRAGLFINLVPIFGAILAIVILGERFETYHALGLLLVLSGIALAENTARRRSTSNN